MKTEKWLSGKLRDRKLFKQLRAFSFELCGVPGVPDLYLLSPVIPSLWVELKIAPTESCLIPFRPGQPQWLDEHDLAGGFALVLVWIDSTSRLLLFRASRVRALATRKIKDSGWWQIANLDGSAPGIWETLEEVLERTPRSKFNGSSGSFRPR